MIRIIKKSIYAKSKYIQFLSLKRNWRVIKKTAEIDNDKDFAIKYYNKRTGRLLNLDNPTTFDDKLWYLKLYKKDPLLTICSDKYRVREYVESCGLKHILNELYGVWDNANDIDFSTLPSQCFIKCNHLSGANIIYDSQRSFDKKDFIRKFNFLLKQNNYWQNREWNYKDIPPKIIAEKVIRDSAGQLPIDYKFFCFMGKAKLAFVDVGVANEEGGHASDDEWQVFDLDFNPMDITMRVPSQITRQIKKPETWDKMIEYAETLSKPFEHCRVDFYSPDGEIVFGEMTFYHCSGCVMVEPREWDFKDGKLD